MIRLIFLLLVLLFLLNPFSLAWLSNRALVVDDGLQPADLIVPLQGDAEEQRLRTDEAARLVEKHYAPVLLLDVDARPFFGHPEDNLIQEYLVQKGFPARQLRWCKSTSDSTAEEARALRACFERLGARQVIIVTSEYHTRRTRFLFRHALSGTGIVALIHPVYIQEYWNPHWWRRRRWAKTFFQESFKLVWTFVEQWSSDLRRAFLGDRDQSPATVAFFRFDSKKSRTRCQPSLAASAL